MRKKIRVRYIISERQYLSSLHEEDYYKYEGWEHQICRSVFQLGLQVFLCYIRNNYEEEKYSKHIFGHNLTGYPITPNFFLKRFDLSLSFIYSIFKESYDIYHFHDVLSWTGLLAMLICKFKRIPCVLQFHNSLLLDYRIKDKLWKKFSSFLASSIIVQAPREYKLAKKMLMISDKKLKLIHLGVNENDFFPIDPKKAKTKLHLDNSKRYILLVGRFSEIKRIVETVKILSESLVKHPSIGLLIVGYGPRYQRIKQIYQKFKDIIDIHLFTIQNHKYLRLLYNAASLTIIPSLLESYSIVFLESSFCCTPVLISTGIGILPYYYSQNQGCFIFKTMKLNSIAKVVFDILEDHENLYKTGQRARNISLNKMSITRTAKRYKELYKGLIK